MNMTDRFESELAAWLIDTAVPMTLDDIDPIVELTAGVRQRPGWTFPGRWLPMRATTLGRQLRTPPLRVVAVLAALLILVAALLAIRAGSQPNVLDTFGLARNGLVVYGAGGDIVTVDPETGVTATLVGGVDDDAVPVFSRDGTRIAFTRSVAGEQTLFIVAADGSGLRQLTDPTDIVGPTWSPDDSEIAFANGDLMVVAADGSGTRRLDLGDVRAQLAQWRPPDGQQIMFRDAEDNVSLYLVGRDGTGLAPIRLADGSDVTRPCDRLDARRHAAGHVARDGGSRGRPVATPCPDRRRRRPGHGRLGGRTAARDRTLGGRPLARRDPGDRRGRRDRRRRRLARRRRPGGWVLAGRDDRTDLRGRRLSVRVVAGRADHLRQGRCAGA